MADTVRVRAIKTFGLVGRVFAPGWREIPAEKIAHLVRRGLIAPPDEGVGEGAAAIQAGPQTATPLPDDFPGAEHLRAASLMTLEAVRPLTKDELLAVRGIGPATAEKILAAGGADEKGRQEEVEQKEGG